MKNSKLWLAALAVASVVGFGSSAVAGPWSGPYAMTLPSPPNYDTSAGTGTISGASLIVSSLSSASIYYAGPLTVDLSSIGSLIVFCDDYKHDLPFSATYYMSNPATPSDITSYLGLPTATVNEIEGLTAAGIYNYSFHTLSAEDGAAIQVAIWELEYGGTATLSTDAGFQALVTSLIGSASGYYSTALGIGFEFAQLVSPGSHCDAGSPSTYTLATCQNQGLITAFYENHTQNVPEPLTISLFGAGLAGAAAVRRRKAGKAK